MIGNRLRLRALVLACLVVLATTPFVGATLAGLADTDRTVADADLDPGGTTQVTTTMTMGDDGGTLSISESFSPEFKSVENLTVTVDGEPANPILAQAEPSGLVVTFESDVDPNVVVEVSYTVTVSGTSGTVHTINGTAASEDGETVIGESTLQAGEGPTPTASPTVTPEQTTSSGTTPAPTTTPVPTTSAAEPTQTLDHDTAADSDFNSNGGGGDGNEETTTSGSGPVLSASGLALLATLLVLGYVARRQRSHQ
jgi:hypothetical protein